MKPELGNDILDSRDVIEHWEELVSQKEDLDSVVDECYKVRSEVQTALQDAPDSQKDELQEKVDDAQEALDDAIAASYVFLEVEEYYLWEQLVEEGEEYSEWSYGETLILESYFEQYTQDLIDECFEIPTEMDSSNWPYRHFKLDLESASEELKSDYTTIEVGSYVYYIHLC